MATSAKAEHLLAELRKVIAQDLQVKQVRALRLKDAPPLTPEQRQEACALAQDMMRADFLRRRGG